MTVEEGPPRAGRREWTSLLALALATVMITFDMFVLLLALPEITSDLRPGTVQQLWILDVYGFMVGGFLITMGTLGDRIGRRRLLVIGAGCFAVASVLCAFATSAEMLIAARALLGLAGSTLAPSTLALISNMFRDPGQRGMAIGVWAAGFTLGSILGPVAGGLLLAHFWWGAVFLPAVPVMVLLVVLCPILVPEFKDPRPGRLDVVSALLSVTAMVAFVYNLKEVARHGWQTVPAAVGVAGVALGVVFVRRQLHQERPLLDLGLFRDRSFSTMLAGLVLYALIGGSSMFYITQFLQSVSGMTPFEAALCLLPGMAVATVSAMVSPLLGRKIRPAYLIAGGVLGVAAVFAWFTRLGADSGPAVLIVGFAVMGLCEGPLLALGTSLVVGSAPPEKAGSVSSMTQVANEAGASLGVAVMGSVGAGVYARRLDDTAPADLPGAAVAAARESVAGALTAASELPAHLGDPLAAAARGAFAGGMSVFAAVCVVISVVASALIAALLRHVPPTGQEADEVEAGTDDVAVVTSG
ncbi:MFS transporter [Actinomadura viridis]|uniref:MFS transporter n=1 Tax=Actinomadura viridis TaxID=58110 RepID=UPI0036C82BFF